MFEINRITLKGARNVRDLGGFPTEDGRHIKAHRLIRGNELFVMKAEDLKLLTEVYELKKVIDFRTVVERTEHPEPEMPGVVNLHLPALSEKALGVTREGQDTDFTGQLVKQIRTPGFDTTAYMAGIYRDIIRSEKARAVYSQVFDELLAQKEGAVYWHCTAGKDRAGIASIFIEKALGVPEELIQKDYFMTNIFLHEVNERMCANIERTVGDTSIHEDLMKMFMVQPAYLAMMDATIEEEGFKDLDDFIERALGMDDDKIKRLRDMYLE